MALLKKGFRKEILAHNKIFVNIKTVFFDFFINFFLLAKFLLYLVVV